MTDEEKRIFDKYIRPGKRLLSRIKTRFIMLTRSKRIKTIKDVEYLNFELFMKLLCLMMLISLLRVALLGLLDLYYWIFPQAIPLDPATFQPYLIPMIAKTVKGVIHV